MSNQEINYSGVGLNTDSVESQVKKGQLSFALNAVVESFDGNMVTYQNEQSNKFALKFSNNLKPIGIYHITNIDRVVYFLTNNTDHEIGYTDNEQPTYKTLIKADCLNFSLDYPIHQIVVKNTNCGVEIYWTDAYNNMRFLNFEDLPFKEIPDPNNDYKKIKIEGEVDCNKLLAQPNFRIPKVETTEVVEGGTIKEGAYQFVVQYANSKGESYSQYHNPTNPISIGDPNKVTADFNLPTSKAIRLLVSKLDTTGLFDYFNLVVIENINAIATPKLVGTYPITSETQEVLYTGNTNQAINITYEELFQKYQKYDTAGGVTSTDDRIVWYDLKENHRVNYQQVAASIPIRWETVAIPYDNQNAYKRALNTEKYKGYMRDEVYPFAIVFINKNGRESDRFPLVGRLSNAYDRELQGISIFNQKPRWQNENTATLEATFTHRDYEPYQQGEFGYWESVERYPNNHEIWGDLAGQPIRYPKFPDELVSPRFRTIGTRTYIYPIGLKMDKLDVINAINSSNLTDAQKDNIIGFKIVRGDRTSGNASIVAKGHFTNVGKYEDEGQTYYFSNYPYNSLKDDPLFARNEISPLVGFSAANTLRPFDNNPLNRLTFHSPDTHFSQPFGIDSGYVKLEAIDYGKARIHFDEVDNNAQYKFLTKETLMVSVGLAAGVAFDYTRSGVPEFNGTNAMSVFESNMELFRKLAPYTNFGYNINSVAKFSSSFAIPNSNSKNFTISYGKYLNSEFNSIDNGDIINNKYRESSVYLKLTNRVLPAHQYSSIIPQDNSRIIASEKVDPLSVSLIEFLQKLKDQDQDAVAAFTLGMLDATLELAGGSDNKSLVLLPTIGRFAQYIVDNGTASDINILNGRQIDCGTGNCHSILSSTIVHQDIPQVVNVSFSLLLPFTQVQDIYENRKDFNNTVIDLNIPSLCSNDIIPVKYLKDVYDGTALEVDSLYGQFFNPPPTSADSEDIQVDLFAGILTSIYGFNTDNVCGGEIQNAIYQSFERGRQYYEELSPTITSLRALNAERERDVNAYYGSIKKNLPAQWGRVNSYDVVDTGIYYELTDDNYPTIFGGDTFINEFSFKTKLSVYNQKTVGTPNDSDIALDEQGNLGRPMFWLSTKPLDYDFQFSQKDLEMSLGGIGLTNIKAYTGSILQSIGGAIIGVGGAITVGAGATGYGAVVGVIVVAVGAILSVAGSLFKNTRSKLQKASFKLYKSLFQQIIEKIGVKNINLDLIRKKGIIHQGLIYQYVFGNPVYFVESQVNVDLRQATNENEGNYYPRVGEGIPDDWLQVNRVPIEFDNIYNYNKTFSKQNKENFYSYLREDYDFSKLCFQEFPNRAMWSDRTNLNETLNNWLIYRPLNQYDFPKEYGKLTALNGILNRQVLARFENKSQLYNTAVRLNAESVEVYIGSPELFKGQPPLDIVDTDNGSMGSQHKWLIKTDMGMVYIDSERGQVVLMQGSNPKILSDIDNEKFFKENLPFYIRKDFPSYNTDNHFKDIGLHGVYDSINRRIIITKKDYQLLNKNVKLRNNQFYLGEQEIQLTSEHFCDRSWTMSFSFRTGAWVSWHSYTPNSYIGYGTYFQNVTGSDVWTHGKEFDSYCRFNNTQEPYVLEYPFVYKKQDEIIQHVEDYSTSLSYTDPDISYENDELLYFNKAFIRSTQQNTGMLNLIPRPLNNMAAYLTYPKYNQDSKDILISKSDGIVSFNTFWDISKDKNKPTIQLSCDKLHLELDDSNLDYTNKSFSKAPIRAKGVKIRLIRDIETNFKLISNFIVTQSQTSIK